jgi:hypothetical protein
MKNAPLPWTPPASAGEEFTPRSALWSFAGLLFVVRGLTGLGLLILCTAEVWAVQWRQPALGFYVLGGGLFLLCGGIWFALIWFQPAPIRVVLGPDALQVQQGLADVVDQVPYRLIRELSILYFPKISGGRPRGLALRLTSLETYLTVWPHHEHRRQRDLAQTGYEWFLTDYRLPWEELAQALRDKLSVSGRRGPS